MQQDPQPHDIARLVRSHLGTDVIRASRFPTGLEHYVYDVWTADGRNVVVCMSRPDAWPRFMAALGWHRLLSPLGVPLPEILAHAEPDALFPYMLLERLPGSDLGEVYPALLRGEKRALAERMGGIQRLMGTMPLGPGFGYAVSYDDPALHSSWEDVIRADLERSRQRIVAVASVPVAVVDRVEALLPRFQPYLSAVKPVPFLDDTTTKNVLIHDGQLAGIVDVDWVCFGDPLLMVGLTRMGLLELACDTEYTDDLMQVMDVDGPGRAAVNFYTAVFCVNFLGELGHHFNRDMPLDAGAAEIGRLTSILDGLLCRLDAS